VAEWIFNRNGQATMLFDRDCIRNQRGQVVSWIVGNSFYSLNGSHKGWYENGVFYDSGNYAIGFLRNATGYLPSRPGLSGQPGLPGLAGRPGRPGLSGAPGRPGYGGWSNYNFEDYFD